MNEQLSHILGQLSPVAGAGRIDPAALLQAHEQAAVTSLRLNPRKPADLSFALTGQVPWCSTGRYLGERPVFTLDPLFHAGAYYVQEASSMFVQHAVEALADRTGPALRLLDLCAAPGGKSTLLAGLLRDEDLLIANEVIQPRAAILAENMSRWGQMNTWVTQNDPKDFTALGAYFDIMLIDAPCTGSGLWRKDEAAMDEWSPEHVKLCSERQKRIVADALPALKPGGLLLYATCSYSPEENEEVLDWLCDNFQLESQAVPVQEDWQIVETRSAAHQAYGYRFYPWKLQGEGFFLAAFRKPEDQEEAPQKKDRSEKKKGAAGAARKGKDESARWSRFMKVPLLAVERNEEFYGLHPVHQKDYEYLQPRLRIKKTGTALGKLAGKDEIPDHELALSIHLSAELPALEVSREEALLFMKKEEIRKEHALKGWQVVTFGGLGLGWGKWLPNRMNNYYPKNWRIRMDIR
ncbi:RsmB/NOP family class I SAM-dependent RNA methyltransferase [Taibaiella chishuiensis]|uniref:16S rRNA C967 or C1407 C5-methylase (RsmB/RsmF family) n=1 Tax=Taibaiella chishuiensis TaxID=1434707 RepID=A0A2P8CVM1_9BACT|nr:RsmB/NOP family class I SAM-dependent RNA methyltransferase [Taibaiella chishuiensis]PSK89012.1 16S rRNA C967 or C1407 C5-methylase (RsmB/RsmF family) [Taibaiella chishuiensis]